MLEVTKEQVITTAMLFILSWLSYDTE